MSYQRFFDMLVSVPRIKHLWDSRSEKMDVDAFESELAVMSSGEVQIAKFFASVWFHDNSRYGFDLVDAMSTLDSSEVQLIMDWMKNPFWP